MTINAMMALLRVVELGKSVNYNNGRNAKMPVVSQVSATRCALIGRFISTEC